MTSLYIKDTETGEIHKIGDDQHDMLTIRGGVLTYTNLQNGDGCMLGHWGGGYEFVDNTDFHGYNIDPREVTEGD